MHSCWIQMVMRLRHLFISELNSTKSMVNGTMVTEPLMLKVKLSSDGEITMN